MKPKYLQTPPPTEYHSFADWAHSPAANLILWFSLLGSLAVMLMYWMFGINESNTLLYTSPPLSTYETRFISEPITVQGNGNIVVDVSSDIDNAYLDLELRLNDSQRRVAYVTHQAIEFYYGYESGEFWTEGSKHGSIYFSRIPPGNYTLEVFPISNSTQINFQLKTYRNRRNPDYLYALIGWLSLWFVLILYAKLKSN